jgi:hypothetical protein
MIPNFSRIVAAEMDDEMRMHNTLSGYRITGMLVASSWPFCVSDLCFPFARLESLHAFGINVRYLGLVWQHLHQIEHKAFVMSELLARVIKNVRNFYARACAFDALLSSGLEGSDEEGHQPVSFR